MEDVRHVELSEFGKGFCKFGGFQIKDLGEYVRCYKRQYPEVTFIVGCDAAEGKKSYGYAVVVVMVHKGNGAHYIFKRETAERDAIMKRWSKIAKSPTAHIPVKIWGEVERTMRTCEYLEEALAEFKSDPEEKLVEAHLDINGSPQWASNSLYEAGRGYFNGYGVPVKLKPDAFAASHAADLISRSISSSRR